MLFNSYVFLFAFLPITLAGFFALARFINPRMAMIWILCASLFFYGWWDSKYLLLLVGSILCNYSLGQIIQRLDHRATQKIILCFGILSNLAAIGYYKYAGFFVQILTDLGLPSRTPASIVLPLGISFFTFCQITYLVDSYYDKVKGHGFIEYAIFVTFFPHLIAGPILHHKDIIPQFQLSRTYRFMPISATIGSCLFIVGLCKKVLVADTLALSVNPVFFAAENGEVIDFFAAWLAAIGYTLQLYFDFSGYSDMAVGLGLLFGVRLPINFLSPYRATNIIDFWRRWHISLSRFLRDYVYIPLGGNRLGLARRHINILITMLIGGLWHGAGWTFVFWGGVHGVYLVINHLWRKAFKPLLPVSLVSGRAYGVSSHALTFLSVVAAWVFFRAETFHGAMAILAAMTGQSGYRLAEGHMALLGPLGSMLYGLGVEATAIPTFRISHAAFTGVALLFVFMLPNAYQILPRFRTSIASLGFIATERRRLSVAALSTWKVALFIGVLFSLSIASLTRVSQFIYFQF